MSHNQLYTKDTHYYICHHTAQQVPQTLMVAHQPRQPQVVAQGQADLSPLPTANPLKRHFATFSSHQHHEVMRARSLWKDLSLFQPPAHGPARSSTAGKAAGGSMFQYCQELAAISWE